VSVAIKDYLAPGYFVSYSRRQQGVAFLLRTLLSNEARSIWFDTDNIVVGDTWFEEIRKGVGIADELILFLSDDSIASKIVESEVKLAQAGGKAVRPIAVAEITSPLPEHLRDIHYLSVFDVIDDEPRLRRRLVLHFGEPAAGSGPDALLKLHACRRIWPCFSEDLVTSKGRCLAQAYASQFDRLCSSYAADSVIRLNAGLALCMVGRWTEGVLHLRHYAHAANNLPGWLFLAMHLLQRESVRNVPLARVKEALDAIRAALQFGQNPLALLTAAILESGGENLGHRHLDRRMHDFAAAAAAPLETASEYVRALWCLKPSFPCLFSYQQPIQTLIREIARDRHIKE
jgi:hypothetical protein